MTKAQTQCLWAMRYGKLGECQCSSLDSLRVAQALRGALTFGDGWNWIIHNNLLIVYSGEHRKRSIRTAIKVEDIDLRPWCHVTNWVFNEFGQLSFDLEKCDQTWDLFSKFREAGLVK